MQDLSNTKATFTVQLVRNTLNSTFVLNLTGIQISICTDLENIKAASK